MGAQTFNRYNLFYRLERQLLLFERGADPNKQDESRLPSESEAQKYASLEMPTLPPRYQHLEMPDLWFLSSKSSAKKRSHRKSHGVASFTEIAQIVASNWKTIDEVTMNFVTDLSSILKDYVVEHGIDTDGKNNNNNNSPTGPPSSSKKDKSTSSKDKKKKMKKRASQSLEESSSPLHEEKTSISYPYDMLQSVLNPQDNNNDHDYRSSTPVASNCTTPYTFSDVFGLSSSTKDGSVTNGNMPNLVSLSRRSSSCDTIPSPTTSKSNSLTASDDNLLSNMEQSFLSHIFSSQSTEDTRTAEGTTGTSDPQGGPRQPVGNLLVDNPQPSIAELLAVMSGKKANTTIGNDLQGQGYHRRASMPDILPSSLSRMPLKGSFQHFVGVQSEGSSNQSYSNDPKRQRTRRASDFGPHPCNTTNANGGEGRVQELDIRDEEIFAMWRTSSPGPWTPTGHNRAA